MRPATSSRAHIPAHIWMLLLAMTACGFPKTGAVPGALSPAQVTAATGRWPDATQPQLEMGRSLFIARCNHCHGYPDIDSIGEDRWPGIMDRMGKNASLDASQRDAVLHFVLASRGAPGT